MCNPETARTARMTNSELVARRTTAILQMFLVVGSLVRVL